MRLDYDDIYRDHAEAYDRMVSAEDCDGNLRPGLDSILPLQGCDVVEIGAGTGRLTRLLVGAGAARVLAIEPSAGMLAVARRRLRELDGGGRPGAWLLAQGLAGNIPAVNHGCDVAIAGWVFGHEVRWAPEEWNGRIDGYIDEMDRVTRPGGVQILLETLGTATEHPAPPTSGLAAYYEFLERERGFERRVISTDYRFPSPEEAVRISGFFFGEEFAARVIEKRWARVPEWTGIWWRKR